MLLSLKDSEIQELKYRCFIDEHENGHFLQTIEWGDFKSMGDWKKEFIVLCKNEEIIASSMILIRNIPFSKKKIAYIPRGPILNYDDSDLITEFVKEVKKMSKEKNIIFVKIDPCVKYISRDINGNRTEDFDNSRFITKFKEFGFVHKGFDLNFNGVQPRFSMHLDISRDLSAVFNDFHKKTKYKIKLAERKGVKVIKGNKEDLSTFKELMDITATRNNFTPRKLEYFERMYDTLNPTGKLELFLSKFDLNEALSISKNALANENNCYDKLNSDLVKLISSDNIKKISSLRNKIEVSLKRRLKLEKEIKELTKEISTTGSSIILSGAIVIKSGKKAWYLYGASSNEYKHLMSNYLLQWNMITWAKEHGCNLYDFRGISGDLSEENPLYGLYKFKKGFNPEFVEYIGEFDIAINKFHYFIWNKLLYISNKIKSTKLKIATYKKKKEA